MPPADYVDAAMTGAIMTSRPVTSLQSAAVGGAKCQQPMGAQFSHQVRSVWRYAYLWAVYQF